MADKLVQIHHVIPQKLFNNKVYGDFLNDLGLYQDELRNLVVLPTRKGKKAGPGKSRSVHDGCHIGDYFNSIDDFLLKIKGSVESGAISKLEAKELILAEQARVRQGLREGLIPLHKFHDEYLALAVLGMTDAEMQAFASEIAETASKQMEKALDTHLGSYLRCQGYTGKEGVMGWLGFAVDLVNPLDDVAIINDLQTLMGYDPFKQSPEEFVQEQFDSIEYWRRMNAPVFFMPF